MKLLSALIFGQIALFAWIWRYGTRLGWYRGCGELPPQENRP